MPDMSLSDAKIYIAAPAAFHSGGPELLHQLCFKLRKHGYDAIMWYCTVPGQDEVLVHPLYEPYENPARKYLDIEGDSASKRYCVLPEATPMKSYIEALEALSIIPIIWWLSVDNYFFPNMPPDSPWFGDDPDIAGMKQKPISHLIQSAYAGWFVRERMRIPEKVGIYTLKDFLRKEYLTKDDKAMPLSKDRLPVVLFNPKKGGEFTNKLLNYAQGQRENEGLIWWAIIDMIPEQIAYLISKSRLYIDFGNHPGMDRMPREAAVGGCCVITGKKGAAAFYEDVPIPDIYKFDDIDDNIPDIFSMIVELVFNYDAHIERFANYRAFIRPQETQFEEDMISAFSKIICQ